MNNDKILGLLEKLDPRWVRVIEKYLNKIPSIKKEIDGRTEAIMVDMEASVRPYKDDYPTYRRLPQKGINRAKVKALMAEMSAKEKSKWQKGYASGTVYHGEQAHSDFLSEVYALHSQTNPLHSDIFPSIVKYEAEIIAMTAGMLGASHTENEICGSVSSGGTESILLAMKTYRDWYSESGNGRAGNGARRLSQSRPVF